MTHEAVGIFNQALDFWRTGQTPELPELAVKHIGETLVFAREHPEAVTERAQQLDASIARFNRQRAGGGFAPDEVNCIRLATEILANDETLPQLVEMPADNLSRQSFFKGFLRLVKFHYYTFLDKPELEDPKILITGLLVDGYGFALRAKRNCEKRQQRIGHGDLIIVNAICEMVAPGELQTEMYLANWFKPDYGLTPEFCDRINNQFK